MKMKSSQTLLFLSCLLGVTADTVYEDIAINGCSETDGEDMYGLEGEELYHADFINKKEVEPQPKFVDHISCPTCYDNAEAHLAACKQDLKITQTAYKDTPVETDAPHSTIYTRDVVELGVENHLICHVTGFYPAPVKVYWTRNDENVTEGTSLNVPFPNKDGTFNQFSRLSFIPQLGDTYSCSVTHRALSQTLTRIWDVEQNQPGIGPAVFCGLGLTVGLLGVATGTFFLIKGNECN